MDKEICRPAVRNGRVNPVCTRQWILLAVFFFLVTGCATVGPDYVSPKIPLRDNWHTDLAKGPVTVQTDSTAMISWWTALNDPQLSSLIERAVSGNLELKKAKARIREARARRRLAAGGLFPTLEATASGSRTRSSETVGTGLTTDLYSIGFDAQWELDLFGGQRRNVEAAQASLESTQIGRQDVLVSLLAEVAVNYLEVRTFQARLSTVEKNLESQKETYQLTLWRGEAGLVDELSVQQALYAVENLRSQLPVLRTGLEEALNRIAILLGEQPGKVHKELEERKPVPEVPLNLAVGVPADLLRRRPDVRRAERDLAAQTARIGAATADLYPKIMLSGSIGLESLALDKLFFGESQKFLGGLGFSWPIFHAGAIRQNIEIQNALQEQALIAYEAAVLNALGEVENALVAYAEEFNRNQSLKETVLAAQRVLELTQDKFEAGLTDFGRVLEAQIAVWSFQDQLRISQGNQASNLVRLYKALGGGWESWAQDLKQKS